MSDILKRIHDAEFDEDDVLSNEEIDALIVQLKKYRMAAAECAAGLMVINAVYRDKFLPQLCDQIDRGLDLFTEAVESECGETVDD